MPLIPISPTVGRKWPTIDLLTLYVKREAADWNSFLTRALATNDVEGLKKTLYGIQAGMADLAKQNLASEEINAFFYRLQRSIENTARQIYRKIYPNPLDNPLADKSDSTWQRALEAKRKRDQAFERFIREASF